MELACDFNRHLGLQSLWHLGVINWRKDSGAMMGVVGTVGRCRSRQAFMNMGSKFMLEISKNIYNRFLFYFFSDKEYFRIL